jgi:monofunctional chorismate mutase
MTAALRATQTAQPTATLPRVGYQGEPGAYGEAAVRAAWGDAAEATPVGGFDVLLDALAHGALERAVLPVENTIVGAVWPALAALVASEGFGDGVAVVGETTVPVRHCLVAQPGATLEGLRQVISHPVALAQCGAFLRRHPHIVAEGVGDTGGAARTVSVGDDLAIAAIASREAAERYGLVVLEEGVQDRAENVTRFWMLGARCSVLGSPPRGAVVRSAFVVKGDGVESVVAALSLVGSDVRCLAAGEGAWIVELVHRVGPPDPETVIRRIAEGCRVRAIGSWGVPEDRPGGLSYRDGVAAPCAWAVRGATTVAVDRKAELHGATQELLRELLDRNGIGPGDVVSAVFTVTPDLTSDFPAHAARTLGAAWRDVPLLCASEIAVDGALPRCIRVLLQVHAPPPADGVRHVYLREAVRLRPDLALAGRRVSGA